MASRAVIVVGVDGSPKTVVEYPGDSSGGTSPVAPIYRQWWVDGQTAVPDASQTGSASTPFKTLAQLTPLLNPGGGDKVNITGAPPDGGAPWVIPSGSIELVLSSFTTLSEVQSTGTAGSDSMLIRGGHIIDLATASDTNVFLLDAAAVDNVTTALGAVYIGPNCRNLTVANTDESTPTVYYGYPLSFPTQPTGPGDNFVSSDPFNPVAGLQSVSFLLPLIPNGPEPKPESLLVTGVCIINPSQGPGTLLYTGNAVIGDDGGGHMRITLLMYGVDAPSGTGAVLKAQFTVAQPFASQNVLPPP
jgi:hypothetical protein